MAAGALLLSMVVASCNDTTDTIGQTIHQGWSRVVKNGNRKPRPHD